MIFDNVVELKEHMRFQRAKKINGHPDLKVEAPTPLKAPFKFNINGRTKVIMDLTPDPVPDTVPVVVAPVEQIAPLVPEIVPVETAPVVPVVEVVPEVKEELK